MNELRDGNKYSVRPCIAIESSNYAVLLYLATSMGHAHKAILDIVIEGVVTLQLLAYQCEYIVSIFF